MTESLEELQVKVAFLEDAVAKLSDEFYLQSKQLQALRQQHAALVDKVRNTQNSDSGQGEVLDEPPPHY
ncbi:MAG: SlyX family protein [Gammaproteobacteria bacterium]|nr:SlyX family protein [Gammaproteobacteria bacterium]